MPSSLQPILRRSLSLAVFTGAGLAIAGAQTAASGTGSAAPYGPVNEQLLSFQTTTTPAYSSSLDMSSSVGDYDPAQAAQSQLASLETAIKLPGVDAQYGQRRRYGAPRYRGGNTNADGSEKYTGFVGGGLTLPLGDTHRYYTPSWGVQVGAGRNFNKNVGVNLEFNWDNFGLQGNTIQQQTYIYDPTGTQGLQGYLDGYSHVWSLSLQPIYNLKQGEGLGAYVTAGAGFYHKITTFTVPQEEVIYTYFGPEEYTANTPIDSYTSNAPGFNLGFGGTYKFSKFANERFYAEARYVVTLNSQRQGVNGSNYNSYPGYAYPTANLFPANSNRSTYVPVKFGIRF